MINSPKERVISVIPNHDTRKPSDGISMDLVLAPRMNGKENHNQNHKDKSHKIDMMTIDVERGASKANGRDKLGEGTSSARAKARDKADRDRDREKRHHRDRDGEETYSHFEKSSSPHVRSLSAVHGGGHGGHGTGSSRQRDKQHRAASLFGADFLPGSADEGGSGSGGSGGRHLTVAHATSGTGSRRNSKAVAASAAALAASHAHTDPLGSRKLSRHIERDDEFGSDKFPRAVHVLVLHGSESAQSGGDKSRDKRERSAAVERQKEGDRHERERNDNDSPGDRARRKSQRDPEQDADESTPEPSARHANEDQQIRAVSLENPNARAMMARRNSRSVAVDSPKDSSRELAAKDKEKSREHRLRNRDSPHESSGKRSRSGTPHAERSRTPKGERGRDRDRNRDRDRRDASPQPQPLPLSRAVHRRGSDSSIHLHSGNAKRDSLANLSAQLQRDRDRANKDELTALASFHEERRGSGDKLGSGSLRNKHKRAHSSDRSPHQAQAGLSSDRHNRKASVAAATSSPRQHPLERRNSMSSLRDRLERERGRPSPAAKPMPPAEPVKRSIFWLGS